MQIVTGGSATITVTLDGVSIFTTTTVNTCGATDLPLPLGLGDVNINSIACPTTVGGAVSFSMSVTLPTIAPSGAYDFNIAALDQSGNSAYCLDVQFSL